MELFTNSELLYEGRKSNLSQEHIKKLLKVDLSKIESFVKLYITYDGIHFPRQAMMFRNKFYDVPKGEWI